MLGTFRLVLALMVAISHVVPRRAELDPGVAHWLPNPGVIAVIGFYLISGYVMTGLLRNHFPTRRSIPAFWFDRALRLYPQYLFVAGLTLTWMLMTGARTEYLQYTPDLWDLLANLLIVPLNFYMFNGTDRFSLVPPAWSLGAEVQFYLLLPVLLLWRARLVGFLVSLFIYILAGMQVIESDWYGFRLLPGVLFVFLLGSYLYDLQRSDTGHAAARRLVVGAAAGAAGFGLLLAALGKLVLSHTAETLLGIVLCLPLLWLLGMRRRRSWDERLGDLAYGVFLNHFLVQWAIVGRVDGVTRGVVFICAVIVLSGLQQWVVERPAIAWRDALRRRRQQKLSRSP